MKGIERESRDYCLSYRIEAIKALGRVREVINDMVLFRENGFHTYFVEEKQNHEKNSETQGFKALSA